MVPSGGRAVAGIGWLVVTPMERVDIPGWVVPSGGGRPVAGIGWPVTTSMEGVWALGKRIYLSGRQ